MPVDGGWTWKFDEDLLTSLTDAERKPEEFQALTTTLGVIFGADSELFSRRTLEYMQESEILILLGDGLQNYLFCCSF